MSWMHSRQNLQQTFNKQKTRTLFRRWKKKTKIILRRKLFTFSREEDETRWAGEGNDSSTTKSKYKQQIKKVWAATFSKLKIRELNIKFASVKRLLPKNQTPKHVKIKIFNSPHYLNVKDYLKGKLGSFRGEIRWRNSNKIFEFLSSFPKWKIFKDLWKWGKGNNDLID